MLEPTFVLSKYKTGNPKKIWINAETIICSNISSYVYGHEKLLIIPNIKIHDISMTNI